jgi:hypothetical protein
MLTGAYLGVLAKHGEGQPLPAEARAAIARISDRLTPAIRGTLVAAAIIWLSQPLIAEMASYRSVRLLERGETRDAIYWLSVAQRLEPRYPVHYWSEAMIWYQQLAVSRNPLFAAEADTRFVEGIRANPYEIACLFGRVALHSSYPELLKKPASPEEILGWTRRAVALRPQEGRVQAEHARALARVGRVDEARSLARALSVKFPDSRAVRRLGKEL